IQKKEPGGRSVVIHRAPPQSSVAAGVNSLTVLSPLANTGTANNPVVGLTGNDFSTNCGGNLVCSPTVNYCGTPNLNTKPNRTFNSGAFGTLGTSGTTTLGGDVSLLNGSHLRAYGGGGGGSAGVDVAAGGSGGGIVTIRTPTSATALTLTTTGSGA